jgi:hypothetical protein
MQLLEFVEINNPITYVTLILTDSSGRSTVVVVLSFLLREDTERDVLKRKLTVSGHL